MRRKKRYVIFSTRLEKPNRESFSNNLTVEFIADPNSYSNIITYKILAEKNCTVAHKSKAPYGCDTNVSTDAT